MHSHNCLNCAAPIDVDAIECPYCHTSYFDLTAIDLDSRAPVVLKLRLPGGDILKTMAIPTLGALTASSESCYAYGGLGQKPLSVNSSLGMDIDLSFTSVYMGPQRSIYTLEVKQ